LYVFACEPPLLHIIGSNVRPYLNSELGGVAVCAKAYTFGERDTSSAFKMI
jgi:hypothetical protein